MKIKLSLLFLGLSMAAAMLAVLVATPHAQSGPAYYTSPPANVAVVISGKHITIDYYAPSMHGRKIFGGLVPYGYVWCPGANFATKITSDADLDIGGLKIPAGSYSIWALPDPVQWTLIVNKMTGQTHMDYDDSTDFGNTKMNMKKLDTPVETFRIELRPGQGNPPSDTNRGTLALIWETTEASVPFTVITKAP